MSALIYYKSLDTDYIRVCLFYYASLRYCRHKSPLAIFYNFEE